VRNVSSLQEDRTDRRARMRPPIGFKMTQLGASGFCCDAASVDGVTKPRSPEDSRPLVLDYFEKYHNLRIASCKVVNCVDKNRCPNAFADLPGDGKYQRGKKK
jgi:hypothetical protein